MKLFEPKTKKEKTDEERAKAYDLSLKEYHDHISTQPALQAEYIRIGETLWLLKLEIDKANFVMGSTSIPEKRQQFEELSFKRNTLEQDWRQKEVNLRENILHTFLTLINPYLAEMNVMKTNLLKTGSVTHLQKKIMGHSGEMVEVIKTNHYSIHRAINFLTTQDEQLKGLKGRDSSEILKRVAQIQRDCPTVEFEETVPTMLELENLQELSQMAYDMRNPETVKADPNSTITIENPALAGLYRQREEENKAFEQEKQDKKLEAIKQAKKQLDLNK